jgi:hypothetical protein
MHVTFGTRNRDSVCDQTESDPQYHANFEFLHPRYLCGHSMQGRSYYYQLELNERGGKETVALP